MTNVILIHTDDTGRYIDPYGHAIGTPHLSGLADDGILFRQAFCAGPTCSPSRSAVMTGQSPHVNGMIGLAHRGFDLDQPERHLANQLSDHDVETVLVGQQHEVSRDNLNSLEAARSILGYDRTLTGDPETIDDVEGNQSSIRDRANAAAAAAFIRERTSESDPFFMSFGLYNTHQPLPVDQDIIDPNRIKPPAPLPDLPAIRKEMAGYHLLARNVDACVGKVRSAIESAGIEDETLVIFTTDHGIPFPYMKCDLWDAGIGVSLIARFPGDERAGEVSDALVSTMDLYPTIFDVLGFPIPSWAAGPSLVPLATGQADSVREEIHAEVTYHAAYEPKRCVRTNRYKYIERFDDEHRREVGPNTDHGPSKDALMERGFLERQRPQIALYDLCHDPNERDNLAEDPAYDDVKTSMANRLHTWMRSTNDPLLDGPVSKPPGAVADRRDSVHPDTGEREPANAR